MQRKIFRVPTILQALAWPLTNLLFRFFCRFTVHGADYPLHQNGAPILFVANHRSEFDPIAVRAALPLFWRQAPLFYVTAPLKNFDGEKKSWRFKLYSSSWFFAAWGAFPAKSKTGDYATALAPHSGLLTKHNGCVLIFPEGKIVRDESVPPRIHGGAGYLSQLERVVTIPVSISGFAGMTPKSFFFRKHHASVTFGNPVRVTNVTTQEGDENQYIRIARRLMEPVYLGISAQVMH